MTIENIKKRLNSLMIDESENIDFENFGQSELISFIINKRKSLISESENLLAQMSDGKINKLSELNKKKNKINYYDAKLPLLLFKSNLLADLVIDLNNLN